ncbi:hypothetical protein Bhyg_06945, partial [Pseudolycoriella hygida]
MDMDGESLYLCIRDERYSDRSNSHGTTNDTRSVQGYNEPPTQSAVFYNSPNVHQPQQQFDAPNSFPNAFNNITNAYQPRWQFDASHNISNDFVAPYNDPTVYQPLGQIAAPGNCTNVSEPQSLSDSDAADILQQLEDILNDYHPQWGQSCHCGWSSDDANVFQPQLQDGAPNDCPNDNQPQWQFDASHDISNAFERQDEIVPLYNNPTVYQPLGQFAASGNWQNVSEPQSLIDAPDILQQLDDVPYSANCPKFFDRQSQLYLKRLYGPVFDDCDEVRRKIREYIFTSCPNAWTFTRAINVHHGSLKDFLHRRWKFFNHGAGSKVYPAAYYYFERMRVDHEEEKSKHRLWSEKHYPDGYDLTKSLFRMP